MSFICSNCLQTQVEYFVDGKYQLPSKCSTFSCKGKSFSPQRGVEADGKTKTMDWQKIRIQEKLADDQVDSGRIPRTVECEVTEDLVDLVAPGDVISVSGIVKMHATEEGKGKPNQTQMYILYIDVNSLVKASTNPGETLDEEDEGSSGFTKDFISFSTKDLMGIREIKRFGGNNVFRLLVNSLCPAIFGHELVKAGLILGLLGGRKRTNASNKDINIRGDPHILVVGDPGLGKSQMLSAAVKAAPRGVFVCGNSTTTSGLTVTMTKDSETGETALEAGALVLGDQGICCIDEFDKMGEHQALLEAMEQQSISIAKAGIVCNLPARTSVIAAANPVGGHYNKSKTVSENLRMNSALLSRFDLDKPDVEKDKFISDHIMKVHAGGFKKKERTIYQNIGSNKVQSQIRFNGDELQLEESLKIHSSEVFEPIPVSLLRKYIAYARKYCRPKLTVEASAILQEFYLDLRNKYRSVDTIPITTRQLESMIRLSEARAKAELREFVDKYDAIDVVELMKHSLMESYKDENNMLDFHRSQHGTGMSKKGEPKRFIAELNRISYQTCNKNFSYEELFSIAKGIKLNFTSFQDLIDSLNNQSK
ncbi:DNA replication licensing factor mcm8 [Lobulomyces angularis]|nr:DNA replication licensing factor mcm8 [Lobulomyces angularis]